MKRIISVTLGFKSMKTAYVTIKGIEVMRALRKGQASLYYYGDPLGEMRLVNRVLKCKTFHHPEAASSRTLQQCIFAYINI